jgi:hypothetical protein
MKTNFDDDDNGYVLEEDDPMVQRFVNDEDDFYDEDEMKEMKRQYLHSKSDGLCPICGQPVQLLGKTNNGRLIGDCLDAFTIEQWEREDYD